MACNPATDPQCQPQTDVNVVPSDQTQPGVVGASSVIPNTPDLESPATLVSEPPGTASTVLATSTSQNAATSTSASPEPVQTLGNGSNNGVSKGAVAGIAIGTCILGAAIAFLLAFLLFKKRNRKTNTGLTASSAGLTSYADSSPELVMEAKNAQSPYTRVLSAPPPGPVPQSIYPVPTVDTMLGFLPPVADTTAVQERILALFDQIYRHVDIYYRDVHASITPSMEPDLARFGTPGVDMAELLQVCARPTAVLKHALGAYVLGTTGPRGDREETVFPEQLWRSCTQRPLPTDISTTSTAKSLHRRLSAYIYSSSLNSSLPHSSRASLVPQTSAAMREAAEHFSLTFFPWCNPSCRDAEREEDLLRILSEALDLQVWLFGQPDEWIFHWGAADRGVVVRPEVQKADGRGEGGVVIERDVVAV